MALTLNNFVGFETGGLQEASVISGPVSVEAKAARTGNYGLVLATSGLAKSYSISPFEFVADAGDDQIFGFGLIVDDLTPDVDIDLFQALEGATPVLMLRYELTSGDLILVDAAGTEVDTIVNPFTVGMWHYIEILWQHLDSGDCDVYIDGAASGLSVTTTDFSAAGTFDTYKFAIPANNGVNLYIDDVYMLSGASSVSDFLGPNTEVLGAFQNTVEDATDQGDTLDIGVWADAGHTPGFDPSTRPEYDTDPESGYVGCDEGTRSGPLALITGTVKGGKWIFYLDLSGTKEAEIVVGKYNGAAYSTKGVAITEARNEAYYFHVDESATYVPSADTHYFCQGGSAIGGVDVQFIDMWSMLLHVAPDPSTLDLTDMEFPDQNYYLGPFGT